MTQELDGVGRTSLWVAASRAVESERADALVTDPFARRLAGEEGFAFLAAYQAAVGEGPPVVPVRTRYFDDRIAAAGDVQQVVLLAAGMDARAFRLEFADEVRLYEVDRREVLDYKQARLGDAQPTCARTTVAADLRDDWGAALVAAGFSPAQRTLWLCEGLLVYLDEAAVSGLISRIAALSTPGSTLLCDVSGRRMLDSPFLANRLAFMAKMGAPWCFGVDEPEPFFAALGWQATVTEPGDVAPPRWPLPRVPRQVPGVPRSFLVEARRL
jgi:methyltransferase (TIGR00027 family)